jgi:hypothetical protein
MCSFHDLVSIDYLLDIGANDLCDHILKAVSAFGRVVATIFLLLPIFRSQGEKSATKNRKYLAAAG